MSPTPEPDPFGTAALRDAVLQAWRASPTRFTEDANAEEDLRLGGYADRLFVELAQNAADAATLSGIAGRVKVTAADGELRVANTGAPLDSAGVAALASLRASAKRGGVTVGRFGVGFAAVLAVTTEPRVVSRTGGIRFSAPRTTEAVARLSELDAQLRERQGAVPVLRLPWPVEADEPPLPAGFATEVRLPLNAGVDAGALLAEIAAEVDDVLLTLPVLECIQVGEQVWTRSEAEEGLVKIDRAGSGLYRWLVHSASGEFSAGEAATLGIEAAKHPRWSVLWALPVDGDRVPVPRESDVLHAPTATDERLSLPARLIATAPIEPSRRRVLPGKAVDAVLRAAAAAYPGLVRRVAPEHRLLLVPASGFPLSEVDDQLRELVITQLRERPWVAPAAGGKELAGSAARVLEVDNPELVELLADVVPDLAAPPAAGPHGLRTLAAVGASTVTIGAAMDALIGIERQAAWWRRLYDTLLVLLDARVVTSETLSGLGVPLVDGRTVPGPRGVFLPSFAADPDSGLLDLLSDAAVVGMRIAVPEVVHPLLERLGATSADAVELLNSPVIRAAVERSVPDAASGLDSESLADLVLRLVADTGLGGAAERTWLGALALRSADGDVRRADELLLPDSPLLGVFYSEAVGPDGPIAVLDAEVADRWDRETLVAVGVLDSFAVVADAEPIGPDHDLPDEEEWWSGLAEPPSSLLAVRDLDLVADERWPEALRLLAESPDTWRALTEPAGHAGWWVARSALLAGQAPQQWRLPDCAELAGLFDPLPELGLRRDLVLAAGVRDRLTVDDADDAADLLDRLADPALRPSPGVVLRAHGLLAELAARPETDLGALEPPDAVRAVDGSVVDVGRALVLDVPWLLDVVDADRLVACTGDAAPLADLLDLPLAGELVEGRVVSAGEFVPWTELAAVLAVADLVGVEVPEGGVSTHTELVVMVTGDKRTARWWVDDTGQVHCEDSEAGLARAFAHAIGRWESRHLIAALLADPDPATLLS